MSTANPFAFDLGNPIKLSGLEDGTIIARAQYLHAENSYLVRYVSGAGALTEQWWGESALSPFEFPLQAAA